MVDISNITNVSGFVEVAQFANNETSGVLFTGAMFVFFIIMIMVSLRFGEPFENVFPMASWVMFIVSMFFWYAGLLVTGVPLMFLAFAAIGTLFLYASKR